MTSQQAVVAVCVDGGAGSEALVEWVADNAVPRGGQLVVLTCEPARHDAYSSQHASPKKTVAEAAGRFPWAQGVEVVVAASGSSEGIGTALLERARQLHVSLLALAPHARSATQRALHGSLTDYFVRHAPMPVLVVHGMGDTAAEPASV